MSEKVVDFMSALERKRGKKLEKQETSEESKQENKGGAEEDYFVDNAIRPDFMENRIERSKKKWKLIIEGIMSEKNWPLKLVFKIGFEETTSENLLILDIFDEGPVFSDLEIEDERNHPATVRWEDIVSITTLDGKIYS